MSERAESGRPLNKLHYSFMSPSPDNVCFQKHFPFQIQILEIVLYIMKCLRDGFQGKTQSHCVFCTHHTHKVDSSAATVIWLCLTMAEVRNFRLYYHDSISDLELGFSDGVLQLYYQIVLFKHRYVETYKLI